MSTIFPHYPHYPQQRVCKTAPIFFWQWICYDRMKQGVVGMGGNMKDRWSVPVTAVANEFIDTYMAAANGEYASVRSSVRSRLGPPFIENAAVKTAAFSRLTTEIPQTDFCFNYLTGTPFQECPSFLFVPILFSASQLISLEVAAISQTVAFSA